MIKRFITFGFSILTLISLTLSPIQVLGGEVDHSDIDSFWPQGPEVNAESAILMEASTGLILYEKNIHEQNYPASITKIMTGLLASEHSAPGDILSFSHEAIFDVDLNSSRIGMDVGEQITMNQALYAMMLASANEVSHGIAEHISGNVDDFSTLMNERAKEIGCLNTNFVNPHGLPHDDHKTTAYDMALITRESMKNKNFLKIMSTKTHHIPPTNKQNEVRYMRNHHAFVLDQEFSYKGCVAGKTGYTSKAKFTLVSIANRGDLELISVIMKADSNTDQYRDTKNLFDYGFDNFSIYPIAEIENNGEQDDSLLFTRFNPLLDSLEPPIRTDSNGYLILPKEASFNDANKDVSILDLPQPLEDITSLGEIYYTYNGNYVGSANILYDYNSIDLGLEINDSYKNNYTSADDLATDKSEERKNIIPLIIGLIFLLVALGYYIFIERPRLRRRKNYYKMRERRRRNDDYIK